MDSLRRGSSARTPLLSLAQYAVGARHVAGTATFKRDKLKIYEHAKDAIAGISDNAKLLVGGPFT